MRNQLFCGVDKPVVSLLKWRHSKNSWQTKYLEIGLANFTWILPVFGTFLNTKLDLSLVRLTRAHDLVSRAHEFVSRAHDIKYFTYMSLLGLRTPESIVGP